MHEFGTVSHVGGVNTTYHDVGSGDPLLLLHGSGPGVSAWANWNSVFDAFSNEYRVLAPDLVGFGQTDVPAGFDWSTDGWGAHLIALLDALDVGPVSVIGNSFGGALALWLATHHPERVRDLVLMGSVGVPFALTPGLDTVWGYRAETGERGMRDVMSALAFDQNRITDALITLRTSAASRSATAASHETMFPAPRQRWIERLVVDEHLVKEIAHPVLIVHGRDDRVIPLANSIRLNELIDNSELHVFGRCGHWVQIEANEGFTDTVLNFLHRSTRVVDPAI